MDIVELGLFYSAEVEGPKVKVQYTLTSMGCPAGQMIQEDIERVIRQIPGVEDVESELTFDPPWTPDRMSDDAKFISASARRDDRHRHDVGALLVALTFDDGPSLWTEQILDLLAATGARATFFVCG